MVAKLTMLAAATVAAAVCTNQAMDLVGTSGPTGYQDWSEFDVGHEFGSGWGAPPIVVVDPGFGDLPRALRISFNRSGGHSGMPESGWDIPGPGESIYFRLLFNNMLPDDAVGFDHGLQSNVNDSPILHFWQISSGSGESPSRNHFALGFGSRGAGDDRILYNAALPKRTWLQVEWAIHREGDSRASVEIRITDLDTGQVWTESDWHDNYGIGNLTLDDFPMTINEPANLGSYHFGVSGSGLSGESVLVAAFCVRLDGWCGPYVPGEGG